MTPPVATPGILKPFRAPALIWGAFFPRTMLRALLAKEISRSATNPMTKLIGRPTKLWMPSLIRPAPRTISSKAKWIQHFIALIEPRSLPQVQLKASRMRSHIQFQARTALFAIQDQAPESHPLMTLKVPRILDQPKFRISRNRRHAQFQTLAIQPVSRLHRELIQPRTVLKVPLILAQAKFRMSRTRFQAQFQAFRSLLATQSQAPEIQPRTV